MATIDELEARAENIKACDEAAMRALAEGMRELAVSLPGGSRLAADFAKTARTVDSWAGGPNPDVAFVPIRRLVADLYREWTREGRLD